MIIQHSFATVTVYFVTPTIYEKNHQGTVKQHFYTISIANPDLLLK